MSTAQEPSSESDTTRLIPLPEGENIIRQPPEEQQKASWSLDERPRPLSATWGAARERRYRVLERIQDVVLVEVRNGATVHIGYEVAIIRVQPAELIKGALVPKREVYPSSAKNSDDWGKIAWSYGPNQLAGARERIARILTARELPKPEDLAPQIDSRQDGIRVQILAPVIRTNGDIYRLLKRQGDVAIFRPDRLSTYEVILIQTAPPHYLDKHKSDYDLVERYPDSESWGSAAWSWQSLELADAHFQFILKHGPKKPFHGSPEFHAALKAQKQKTLSR